jgi:hypothetical protein
LALDQKLAAVQMGQPPPTNAKEQLDLAELCRKYKKQYAAAVKFYAAALATEPTLADHLKTAPRYQAASAAALAAAGKGKDAAALDQQEKTKLRQQALTWLQAELKSWQRQLDGKQADPQQVEKALSQWQTDAALAGVRDVKQLAALPEPERLAWQQWWADVAAVLQQARAKVTP